ncbi:hypothetical protein [Streptomyces sp. NPDC060194]|uniref:hypothetical protein n=1 Tax=Streptomyces sp. NPDC060194 TaxID=3347069 RepID=UPI003658C8E2
MISDVEVADDDGEFRPLGGGTAPVVLEPASPPADGIRPRTPRRTALRWAAAGALAASVVWGGALWALWPGDGKPDDGGYSVGASLCGQFRAKGLVAALGTREGDQVTDFERGVLDRAECTFTLRPDPREARGGDTGSSGNGLRTEYGVELVAELRRATDPRAEFEATRDVRLSGRPERIAKVSEVSDLGDRAYLLDGTAEARKELRVLDGGLVVRLSIVGYTTYDGDEPPPDSAGEDPDLSGVEPMMVGDLRALLDEIQ